MQIKNALDMLQALFQSMLRAHDARYISKSMKDNIVFIPVKNVKTMDFTMSDKEKQSVNSIRKRKNRAIFYEFWPK